MLVGFQVAGQPDFVFPGDGGIATRKIAILLADGVDADPVTELIDDLASA